MRVADTLDLAESTIQNTCWWWAANGPCLRDDIAVKNDGISSKELGQVSTHAIQVVQTCDGVLLSRDTVSGKVIMITGCIEPRARSANVIRSRRHPDIVASSGHKLLRGVEGRAGTLDTTIGPLATYGGMGTRKGTHSGVLIRDCYGSVANITDAAACRSLPFDWVGMFEDLRESTDALSEKNDACDGKHDRCGNREGHSTIVGRQ